MPTKGNEEVLQQNAQTNENNNANLVENVVNNSTRKTEKITSRIISAGFVPVPTTTDKNGNTVMQFRCDLFGNDSIASKTTIKSYKEALVGPTITVKHVVEKLEKGEYNILTGGIITFERTYINANEVYTTQSGDVVTKDKDWHIDHIITIDCKEIGRCVAATIINEKADTGFFNKDYTDWIIRQYTGE